MGLRSANLGTSGGGPENNGGSPSPAGTDAVKDAMLRLQSEGVSVSIRKRFSRTFDTAGEFLRPRPRGPSTSRTRMPRHLAWSLRQPVGKPCHVDRRRRSDVLLQMGFRLPDVAQTAKAASP